MQSVDKRYFAKWWRDEEPLKLTSGILKHIFDQDVEKYFKSIKAYEKCGFVKSRIKKYSGSKYLPETIRMKLKYE